LACDAGDLIAHAGFRFVGAHVVAVPILGIAEQRADNLLKLLFTLRGTN
jgi:hypothetical protein